MSNTLPFEGPEKKLHVAFVPSNTTNNDDVSISLRQLSSKQIDQLLQAASCTVLSVTKNDCLDAYLLAESSMFISNFSIMMKTCGSTTLLRSLPYVLRFATSLGLRLASVEYSRIQFCFPERQIYPHDSFQNEVDFLDRILEHKGRPFQLGGVHPAPQWHLYIAQFSNVPSVIPKAPSPDTLQALELFMFDLDRNAMRHYVHEHSPQNIGRDAAVKHTTVKSGISSLLNHRAVVDAFNFEPCGYSLNAIADHAYYTIHVSPEPEVSYVSFETTISSSQLAPLVAAVVHVFRPSRFTVAYLGTTYAHALRDNPKSPIHWTTLGKLLGVEFARTADPTSLHASSRHWATVASYRRRDSVSASRIPDSCRVAATKYAVLDTLASRFSIFATHSGDVLENARTIITDGPGVERPTFIIDLGDMYRRAQLARESFHSRFAMCYAVRCNADPAVLTLLNEMGWSFEAVSIAEVNALHKVGVGRHNISFASPMLTSRILARLHEVGMVTLFGPPSEAVRKAIKKTGMHVQVRVVVGAVEETVAVCEEVLKLGAVLRSLALDCDPDAHQLGPHSVQEIVAKGLQTVREVLDRLPAFVTENVQVSLAQADLFPRYRDGRLIQSVEELNSICAGFPKLSVDPGRWVVGNSASLLVSVIGRKLKSSADGNNGNCSGDRCRAYNYYLNDGVYGAFSSVLIERNAKGKHALPPSPIPLKTCSADANYDNAPSVRAVLAGHGKGLAADKEMRKGGVKELPVSTLFGPTCDALDCIWTGQLPTLCVGDMLLFKGMGAYSASAVSSFNGFAKSFDTRYVIGNRSA